MPGRSAGHRGVRAQTVRWRATGAAAAGTTSSVSAVSRLFPQPAYRAAIRWAILRGLAEAPTSAALRAALYRVLAATPWIRLLGRTRDSIGRYGMAVSVEVVRHPTRDDHRSVDRRAAANEPHDPPPKPPVPRRGARTELPGDISREWNGQIHERTHTLIQAVLIDAHGCERILWSACRRVSHRRLAVRAVAGSWHNFVR